MFAIEHHDLNAIEDANGWHGKIITYGHDGQIRVEDGESGVGCKSIFTLPLRHEA